MADRLHQRRISPSNLPPRLPITGSIVLALVLDRLRLPLWLTGTIVLLWLAYVIGLALFLWTCKRVDVVDTFDPYGGRVLHFTHGALAGQRVMIEPREVFDPVAPHEPEVVL